MAQLYNRGKRTWSDLVKGAPTIGPGKRVDLDKEVAKKFAELYPKDFEYLESEADKIKISKSIKDLIKEVPGMGIKTFAAMFEEKKAYDEDDQLEIVMGLLPKKEEDNNN